MLRRRTNGQSRYLPSLFHGEAVCFAFSHRLKLKLNLLATIREVNNPTALASEPGGSFTIGAVDSSLFTGDIEYVSIPNGLSTWWLVPMTGKLISSSIVHSF